MVVVAKEECRSKQRQLVTPCPRSYTVAPQPGMMQPARMLAWPPPVWAGGAWMPIWTACALLSRQSTTGQAVHTLATHGRSAVHSAWRRTTPSSSPPRRPVGLGKTTRTASPHGPGSELRYLSSACHSACSRALCTGAELIPPTPRRHNSWSSLIRQANQDNYKRPRKRHYPKPWCWLR